MSPGLFLRVVLFVVIVLRGLWLVPLVRQGEYRAAGVDYCRATAPAEFWRAFGSEAFTLTVVAIAILALPDGRQFVGACYLGLALPACACAIATGRVRARFRTIQRSVQPVAYWMLVTLPALMVVFGVAMLVRLVA